MLSLYFHYVPIISPWKTAWPSFKSTLNSFTQECFEPSQAETGPMVLEKKIFIICYHIFTIISPLEKVTIHYDKLESSSVRMIGVKFYWKWHSGSREDEMWKDYRQMDNRQSK